MLHCCSKTCSSCDCVQTKQHCRRVSELANQNRPASHASTRSGEPFPGPANRKKVPGLFLYARCEIVRKVGNLHMNSYALNSSQSSASMFVPSSCFLFLFALALDVVAGAT